MTTTISLAKVPQDAQPQVQLAKGVNIKLAAALAVAQIGLGWNPAATPGTQFDLDAVAVMLDANNKSTADRVVFYNNLKSKPEGSVQHSGDNLTGQGDGDDETLTAELALVPSDVEKIIFLANIYEAKSRNQNFGQVQSAYIRAIDNQTGDVLGKYDLTEDYSANTGVVFGELYRHDGGWKFRALGNGLNGSLEDILASYGIIA